MMSEFIFRTRETVLLCLFVACLPSGARGAELAVSPREVVLFDAFARRQMLVELEGRDATRAAKYVSKNAAIASVDAAGYVTPLAEGMTEIVVIHQGRQAVVPVKVQGIRSGRTVDFSSEIVPLLSRYGCNAGGCHGKQGGQNGFQLSLFGFDQRYDHDAIVKHGRGRRLSLAAPDESLFLRKAAGRTPHGGGARIPETTEAYRLIRRWIEMGAPAASPTAPRVVKLHVTPRERVLRSTDGRGADVRGATAAKTGEVAQQLAIEAEYSDGTRRDVTRQAQFSSNLEPIAAVDEDGLVRTTGQSGEAAIMARYMGHVAVFSAVVPHGPSLQEIPGFEPLTYIDRLAAAKWKKLGLTPSPTCDDATFIRRVTIDLCGRLPTVEETRAFLEETASGDPGSDAPASGRRKPADTAAPPNSPASPASAAGLRRPLAGEPDKRTRLIDRLLDSPDYPAYFALRWGSILRNSRLAGADRASYAFHNWIKDMIARNRPYDEFVRGVVAAAGEWQDAPAINWYWQSRDDQLHQVTADTAQVFLGLRLQCAKCHHHPYERWSQEDYYGLAGFFTRLGRKSFGEPPPYFASPTVTLGDQNPLTGRSPEPKFLDGPYGKFTPEQDPRHALVDWMAKRENPFFARVLVNRLWGHFLGRGLVDQVDDMRESNPASNPELLDALAKDFGEHRFDVKHVIRTIVTSRVYQLSSAPTEGNKQDKQNFARFYARRLIAEVFHDALDQTCGVRTRFSGVSGSARAVDLPHEGFGSYFLDTFDRPRRVTGCECERSSAATLSQVLLLANSDEMENKLSAGDGRIAKLLTAKRPPEEAIAEMYLAAYSRRPTAQELQTNTKYIASQQDPKVASAQDKRQALEDVLWTLVNSKEFMFNH